MKKNLLGISLLTITGLYVILSAIIILISILTETPVEIGIIVSIIILIIQFLISPFLTDLSLKFFYKTKEFTDIPKYLKDFIEEVCKEKKMKFPKMKLIDDGAPNAFTYGHTKNDARIVLTKGIFNLLTEDEVKAVVAHELGHASHYDMLFMTVAQLVPLVLYFIFESCTESDDDKGSGILIGIIAYILYIISNYIVLGLSRNREYYADEFSIEKTKNPNSLASALVKIGFGLTTETTTNKHSASKSNALGIFDSKSSKSLIVSSYDDGEISKENIKQAMKWEQWNIWAKWYELNSTHPLISNRLLAISKRSEEFKQKPYITFDLTKEESYVDDFLIELLINFLPIIILIIGIIGAVLADILININPLLIIGLTILLTTLASILKFNKRYKGTNFQKRQVKDLLGEVKVSHITSIPCSLEGTIIGKGNPGCIFNEDFVIKDDTGIIFLDYNQPIYIMNMIFALFKSEEYFDKKVKVNGWYRRSPVPYIELKTIEIDGKVKNVYTYGFKKFLYALLIIISILLIMLGL